MTTTDGSATLGERYRLERPLGSGGMATVHLAHDTVLDRPVAIKLLARHAIGDEELRARFVREARLAARLSHPHVVRVFDTGEQDGQPYIVMEYVVGRSLAEELRRRGSLPPAEVAELGRQAAAGLAQAHAAGLVHRDVKPQNLLLRSDGLVKVADFGIARGAAGGTITQAGTLLGTAAYVAPELVQGSQATPATDVYSLGAVLYELLAGRPPRQVASLDDVEANEPVPPLDALAPQAPPALVETVMRCLDPDPARRPANAGELALDLEAPATAQLAAPRAPRRPRARAPVAAAVALVLALVLALAVALAAATGGGDPAPAEAPVLEPVPRGQTPAEDARNLAEWLRANAGGR